MKSVWESIRGQYRRYKNAEIQMHSAALAYHTVLAIVPVVALIFWYLRSIGLSKHWFNLVRSFLLSGLEIASDSVLIQHFDRMTSPGRGHGWGWLGVIL